jgi:hypothetical protein
MKSVIGLNILLKNPSDALYRGLHFRNTCMNVRFEFLTAMIEQFYLPGYNAMLSGGSHASFQRNKLPPSRSKSKIIRCTLLTWLQLTSICLKNSKGMLKEKRFSDAEK